MRMKATVMSRKLKHQHEEVGGRVFQEEGTTEVKETTVVYQSISYTEEKGQD